MKFTNTQKGPRGLNTTTGTVLVDPGQTVEAKVFEREREGIEASGWFTVEGDYAANPGEQSAPVSNDALAARVIELEAQVKDRDDEIAKLKKQLPETDIDKMTVPELRAHLAYRDVKFDGTKDKKDDLITLAKAAA